MVLLQVLHFNFNHVDSLAESFELSGVRLYLGFKVVVDFRAHGLLSIKYQRRFRIRIVYLPLLDIEPSQHFEFKFESYIDYKGTTGKDCSDQKKYLLESSSVHAIFPLGRKVFSWQRPCSPTYIEESISGTSNRFIRISISVGSLTLILMVNINFRSTKD